MRHPLAQDESQQEVSNVLVVGMGSCAFGKERRAINALTYMGRVRPHFLISKWGDGSVSGLLQKHRLDYTVTSFGFLGFRRPDWTMINLAQVPRLLLTVVRSYRQQRCSTILVLGLREFLNALPSFLFLKARKARFVFYLGDIPADNFVYGFLSRLAGRIGAAFIVNSDAVKQGVVARGLRDEQVVVVYNGVELDRFQSAEPVGIRAGQGWSSQDVLIGYVGQISENKGVMDFVEAARQVVRENERCRFVITGPLDHQNACLQELKGFLARHGLNEYFAITGRIEQVERVYADLDVVVVPSRFADASPNVSLEAMASGVPVIGTRMGGIPELLADGETGFLVEPQSPSRIAERMVQLTEDADLRKTMGKAGIERVKQKFDIRANARLVESYVIDGGAPVLEL